MLLSSLDFTISIQFYPLSFLHSPFSFVYFLIYSRRDQRELLVSILAPVDDLNGEVPIESVLSENPDYALFANDGKIEQKGERKRIKGVGNSVLDWFRVENDEGKELGTSSSLTPSKEDSSEREKELEVRNSQLHNRMSETTIQLERELEYGQRSVENNETESKKDSGMLGEENEEFQEANSQWEKKVSVLETEMELLWQKQDEEEGDAMLERLRSKREEMEEIREELWQMENQSQNVNIEWKKEGGNSFQAKKIQTLKRDINNGTKKFKDREGKKWIESVKEEKETKDDENMVNERDICIRVEKMRYNEDMLTRDAMKRLLGDKELESDTQQEREAAIERRDSERVDGEMKEKGKLSTRTLDEKNQDTPRLENEKETFDQIEKHARDSASQEASSTKEEGLLSKSYELVDSVRDDVVESRNLRDSIEGEQVKYEEGEVPKGEEGVRAQGRGDGELECSRRESLVGGGGLGGDGEGG